MVEYFDYTGFVFPKTGVFRSADRAAPAAQKAGEGTDREMNSINDIWNGILEILSGTLTPISIRTWFSDCEPVELEEGRFVLHTTSPYKRDILQQRYGKIIKSALHDLFSCDFELLVLCGDELAEYREMLEIWDDEVPGTVLYCPDIIWALRKGLTWDFVPGRALNLRADYLKLN